jgi:phosphoglycerate dehydrogenase-like enzyme
MPDPLVEQLRVHHDVAQKFFVEGEALIQAARGCRGVIAGTESWSLEVMDGVGPSLEAISRVGTGVDSIDLIAATERGIAILNAPGENAQTVAEYSVGVMWSLARGIIEADKSVRTSGFAMRTELSGVELDRKTVGIIGFGEIGRRVAKICHRGFGMKILVSTAHPDVDRLNALGITADFVEIDQLLTASDFVSLNAAVNAQTMHMIGQKELRLMKPTAYLVNPSRGQLVDEVALVDALRQGEIAGYGSDVFDVEPPPPDHPLFSLPNVVLSPHFAGGTNESMARMSERAVKNLTERLAGGQPERTVNPEVYNDG